MNVELVDGVSFLSFKILKKEDQIQLQFLKRTDSDIVLKESEVYTKNSDSKFIIQLRTDKNAAVQEFYLDDILNPVQELFRPNGPIELDVSHVKEKEFTLRVPRIKETYTKALLYELDSSGKIQYLFTTEIN